MIRRFNYTGRKPIPPDRVQIQLMPLEDGGYCFEAQPRLHGLGLPEAAAVVVEAYRQSSYMRFPFGTVNRIEHYPDTTLSEFFDPTSVLFRVKVISTGQAPGLLLAEADGVRPQLEKAESTARPLLHVANEDLEGEAWRLDFDDRPILKVDLKLGSPRLVARNASFVAFVLPPVLRMILGRALDAGADGSDEEGWESDWIRFARSLPGIPDPPDREAEEDRERWVERVAQAFGRQHKILDQWRQLEEGAS